MKSTGTRSAERTKRQFLRIALAAALVVWLILTTGCAHLNSIYRNKPVGDNIQSVSIDAKQRMVFTSPTQDEDGKLTKFRVLCAEPSPDVFSAFAASLSTSLESDSIKAALDGAFSENAATIGLRTQVIQMLRDGMYRICEGVISNQISEDEFYALHQRYQRIMVTLVAIEQLTGAVTPPPIAIQTDALAGRPARLPDLQSDLEDAEQQLAKAQGELAQREEDQKYDPDSPDTEPEDNSHQDLDECSEWEGDAANRPGACQKYFAAKHNRDERKQTVESLEEAIRVARSEVVNQASGQVVVSSAFQRGSTISDGTAATISGTVEKLVGNLWDIDFDTALTKFGEFECDRFVTETEREISSTEIANDANAALDAAEAEVQKAKVQKANGELDPTRINSIAAESYRTNLSKQALQSCLAGQAANRITSLNLTSLQARMETCSREAAMCDVLRQAVSSKMVRD